MTFLSPSARKFRLNRIRVLFAKTIMEVIHDSGFNVPLEVTRKYQATTLRKLVLMARPIADYRRMNDHDRGVRMEGRTWKCSFNDETGEGFFGLWVVTDEEALTGQLIFLIVENGYTYIEVEDKTDFVIESFSSAILTRDVNRSVDVAISHIQNHPLPMPAQALGTNLLYYTISLLGKAGTLEMLNQIVKDSEETIGDDWQDLAERRAETHFEIDAPRSTPEQRETSTNLTRRQRDDEKFRSLIAAISNRK